MKISIVVPVYNAEDYLKECIESVISQTKPDWELILVNDGSTDKSAEICDYYPDKYPDKVFVFHKENEGQFMTRHFGIQKCTGDYIGFLDADDTLDLDFVSSLEEQAAININPDIICFGFCNKFADKEEKIHTPLSGLFDTPEKLQAVFEQVVNGKLPGSMWSKLFKSELLKKVGIDTDFVRTKRYGEDAFHSFTVISHAKSVLFFDKSLYFYRANPEGASQGFDKRDFDYFNTKYVSEVILKYLECNGTDNPEAKKLLLARNFNETVYYMLKYYRASPDGRRRKAVVEHDWSEYLLDGAKEEIKTNKYIRKSYLKVWNAFEKKKHSEIYIREKFKKFLGW